MFVVLSAQESPVMNNAVTELNVMSL